MNKRTLRIFITLAVFCLFASIGLPGAAQAGWLENYYRNNPMTTDQLKAKWGEPANVIQMENGVEKVVFGPKDPEIGYTYFLTRDGRVIDRGTTDNLGKKKAAVKSSGPELTSLMAKYYKNNPMTVDELKAKWGTPISNHDYDNGIKKLTFGPRDAVIGYTYFLVKDGMVVDRNITGTP